MNPVKRLAVVLEHEDGSVTTLMSEGPLTDVHCRTEGIPRPEVKRWSPYAIFQGYWAFDLDVRAVMRSRESDSRVFTVFTSLAWPWQQVSE